MISKSNIKKRSGGRRVAIWHRAGKKASPLQTLGLGLPRRYHSCGSPKVNNNIDAIDNVEVRWTQESPKCEKHSDHVPLAASCLTNGVSCTSEAIAAPSGCLVLERYEEES